MNRRIIALALCLMLLAACAWAEGANAPRIRTATYTNGEVPTFSVEYDDPNRCDWIEVYLLKKGEAEPNMGTIEVDGETYAIVGIQTINPQDPNMYSASEDGSTVLNGEFYFGDGEAPGVGEDVFLTVGLTGEDGEEALGERIPISVPEPGESFTNAPVAIEDSVGE